MQEDAKKKAEEEEAIMGEPLPEPRINIAPIGSDG